ncbi:putative Zinc finger, RING/FYVE/PHD-type [Medicago truncatula]|uniref:Putative Zinc finger, RING/FYVE/PHD-type n=1 Tax=Medicago truncatula TaxID=3880 RepID=A0A396J3W4_MEDTR|nr:putative Zinc finger, RING/FYVE/PHD-type [Medicago truncatula]
MEIDVASEVSAETETEDGSSQGNVEMDVLATESGSTILPQVSVCLTCRDVGFKEALVYCNKCEVYALHSFTFLNVVSPYTLQLLLFGYCLDGPVIFTYEVFWLCDDCEEEVIDIDYPDQDTSDSENGEVDSSEEQCAIHCLKFRNDKFTGLIGHLSNLACPKVHEVTKRLPEVLDAELLQRSDAWLLVDSGKITSAGVALRWCFWDPSRCFFVQVECSLDLEATQKDTNVTQQYCPNFNLEYNVDFNEMVMI